MRSPGLPLHLTAATLLRVSAEGLATALVLTVHARTGDAATAGFLQTALLLPYVLSGPVIGHTLDRVARPRRVAVALAGVYGVATAALLAVAGASPLVLALTIAVVIGLTEPIVVALTSLLPRFVPPDRLPRAYGLEASSYNVAAIAGPGLAAGVASVAGGAYAGAAIVAGAVVGVLALMLLPLPGPGETHDPAATPRDSIRTIVGGGLGVLFGNRVLRALTVGTTFAWTGFGGVAITAVLLARHLGADEAVGGRLLVAMAVGSLAGSLASSRWLTARHAERVMLLGLVAFGAALASLAVVPDVAWAMAAFAAAGVAEGPVFAATLMLRQREAPPGRLGQVNTTAGSLKIGASAIGAGLTGALASTAGPIGLVLAIAACPLLGAATAAVLLRARSS
ncbi:MFS transporter [Actinomadura flavalba]|uniref:MFS transporter n=1 Tax=Actinomadura flavalba TaxID=1120938 RepID=UPI00035D279E|nr:MFS transporter [Actinomadura flavalba]